MKDFLEGSQAIAQVIRLCKPGVISAYPITPQTHIVEELAQLVADGKLSSQFVNVESEHSAASVVLGAVATGVRAYTATSSQGLLYMSEVVYNIAGMRFPVVMTVAARAVSAPINIWNDHQDVMAVRDAGWVQFFAESIQEAVDLHLLAYRLGENPKIMLPVMVAIDGFTLTHGVEVVDIPSQEEIDKFLPSYNPPYKLDVENPLTLGPLVDPEFYQETRFALNQTHKEVLEIIPKIMDEFTKIFGRPSPKLIEGYQLKDAERVIVAMGSACGTIKEVVDEMRKKGKRVGLLKVTCFRPFPAAEIYEALKNIPKVGVIDRAVSLGSFAPLASEIKTIFTGKNKKPKMISSFILGLGGRDITKEAIKEAFRLLTTKEKQGEFIDLKAELLSESYE